MTVRLLEGVRVVEFALLEAGGVGTVLADLGADVVKVERPGEGDYIRRVGWPFVHGVSLMHHHLGRGKRSVAIDIQKPEGARLAERVIGASDIVIEGMRPGVLTRRGLGSATMRERHPALVWCTVSGYGRTGPYTELAAHGLAFDAWAGGLRLGTTDEGFSSAELSVPLGTRVTPLLAAATILAATLRARRTGQGCAIDIAQCEGAAAVDWLTIEGHRAHLRPETEVTGNPSDGGVRRGPGTAGMGDSVRYQVYRSTDGHVLFMATERKFWERFCLAIDRSDLLGDQEGGEVADHALGDRELRGELTKVFLTRSTAAWVEIGLRADVPIAPVNSPATLPEDPHFAARTSWLPAEEYGADLLPLPVHLVDEELTRPAPAATPGQHTDEVLRGLGVSAGELTALREAGVLG
ncbi:CaiB/BaiF CoA transferase family protein [Streptosporangium amethystogenes]|uniref:CaiB/BaiF CoA transferase family protein n=1 Tax=Streptosporangium amethystogenes TaxID=2002 RepID=UPI0004CA8ED6|nr:CoA transferase [Streptosporangium amethystogenes]